MMFFVLTCAAGYLAVIIVAICYAFWPSWRRSWNKGKHVVHLTQTETKVAPEYGSMVRREEEAWAGRELPRRNYGAFGDDYRDWRTQTFDSLSPEALDSTSNEGVDW